MDGRVGDPARPGIGLGVALSGAPPAQRCPDRSDSEQAREDAQQKRAGKGATRSGSRAGEVPNHRLSVSPELACCPVARILLLGSTGFVGRGVAHKILDGGHQLRVLVRDPMKAAAFKVRGAQVVVGDALNPSSVTQAAQGVEHVISLVAVRRNRPQSYLAVNVDGPRILGQASMAAGVRSVVLVSAIGAKLDPHYKYFTSRWMGEQELAKTGVAGTILRFSFVLAEEGGILNDFERALIGPFAVIPGSGQAKLQPILRDDAARCIVETVAKPELLGHIVDLGGPEVVTYETMFDWFLQARGIKKAKLKLPVPLVAIPAIALEAVSTNPPITRDEVNMIQADNLAAGIDSVSSHFGWRPSAPSSWAPVNWAKKPRTGR
ncbi:MAG: NAD-dependent epimerase/dehydratase family protein [Chloroflexi bacterium]|nr:MAG: NAD-dependent epimerase/dehydratase family protein [Chloroflexota bacterium]